VPCTRTFCAQTIMAVTHVERRFGSHSPEATASSVITSRVNGADKNQCRRRFRALPSSGAETTARAVCRCSSVGNHCARWSDEPVHHAPAGSRDKHWGATSSPICHETSGAHQVRVNGLAGCRSPGCGDRRRGVRAPPDRWRRTAAVTTPPVLLQSIGLGFSADFRTGRTDQRPVRFHSWLLAER
jgi:hypothetical protein